VLLRLVVALVERVEVALGRLLIRPLLQVVDDDDDVVALRVGRRALTGGALALERDVDGRAARQDRAAETAGTSLSRGGGRPAS
jgi:hypothetical protein